MSIEGQGHFLYIFQVLYVLSFTRPRYQVSIYRTIGPLVEMHELIIENSLEKKLNGWTNRSGTYMALC